MSHDARLRELGLELPEVRTPSANYVPARIVGNLLYIAGQGPVAPDRSVVIGKLGAGLTTAEGYAAARVVGLNLVAVARWALGSLDRVESVVKVLGMVNSDPDFVAQPAVIDGCSDLLVEVFGDAGRHARSAVGMSSLPGGIAVEVEAILQICD